MGGEWTPKDRKTETEVEQYYKKRHEGERTTEELSKRPKDENLIRRPQIGEQQQQKKKTG